jgi:hypothetical protein
MRRWSLIDTSTLAATLRALAEDIENGTVTVLSHLADNDKGRVGDVDMPTGYITIHTVVRHDGRVAEFRRALVK